MNTHPGAAALAEQLATRLTTPKPPPPDKPWTRHSLAAGSAGIALLHIQRLRAGLAERRQAHTWVADATSGDIQADDSAALFLGAPAVTFMLHTTGQYADTLVTMDAHLKNLAHRRVAVAFERIAAGQLPSFAEYDIFLGLAGIARLLMHRAPTSDATGRVLEYLVALTQPLRLGDTQVPGWWVGHDPHRRYDARNAGHANFGAAHGITGPLAALALAIRRGIVVDGQHQAIATILHWLDQWRQEGASGPWWPETITISELHQRRTRQTAPSRPSWCYGIPGIARAGQLAAMATGDQSRQQHFEHALISTLSDPTKLAMITDAGLCHGWAGVYQTAWRAAADALDRTLTATVNTIVDRLVDASATADGGDAGLLDGAAGIALALHTAARNTEPTEGWDACLLIH